MEHGRLDQNGGCEGTEGQKLPTQEAASALLLCSDHLERMFPFLYTSPKERRASFCQEQERVPGCNPTRREYLEQDGPDVRLLQRQGHRGQVCGLPRR